MEATTPVGKKTLPWWLPGPFPFRKNRVQTVETAVQAGTADRQTGWKRPARVRGQQELPLSAGDQIAQRRTFKGRLSSNIYSRDRHGSRSGGVTLQLSFWRRVPSARASMGRSPFDLPRSNALDSSRSRKAMHMHAFGSKRTWPRIVRGHRHPSQRVPGRERSEVFSSVWNRRLLSWQRLRRLQKAAGSDMHGSKAMGRGNPAPLGQNCDGFPTQVPCSGCGCVPSVLCRCMLLFAGLPIGPAGSIRRPSRLSGTIEVWAAQRSMKLCESKGHI